MKEQVKGKEAGTGLVPKDWEIKTISTPPLSHCKPACLPNTYVDRPKKTTSSLPVPKAKLQKSVGKLKTSFKNIVKHTSQASCLQIV